MASHSEYKRHNDAIARRIASHFATEPGADGKPQAVLPGAERVALADLAKRRANAPLRPAKPQKPCDVGLFSDEADQLDLVEMFQDQPED